MITTKEGIVKKRGQKVWEIGITVDGIRTPTISIVHGGYNDVTNPDRCWSEYDNCLTECEKMNKKEKRKEVCQSLLQDNV